MRKFLALTGVLTLLMASLATSSFTSAAARTKAETTDATDQPVDRAPSLRPQRMGVEVASLTRATRLAADSVAATQAKRSARDVARAVAKALAAVEPRLVGVRVAVGPRVRRAAKVVAPRPVMTLHTNDDGTAGAVGGAWSSMGTWRTTEYCWTGNQTADSKWPQVGMVAVLDRSIPFGSLIKIEGMGTYTVDDWIGHGSDFDIYNGRYGCESRASNYGRQYRHIWILRRG